ncbi:MAG: DMT family transporter [Mesorhizobium sp.]|nr:MAG: DMT family transporter [Mesorhizobium sp.]
MEKSFDGWLSGFIGVLIFSGSLPATRLAVMDFDPTFLTAARAAIAGLLGIAMLLLFREKRPERGDLVSLAVVALGVVVGFPLLTALALKHVTSAHSIIFVGLLPLATAIFGVLRGGDRPRPGQRQAEGARLSRKLGGWQVICWALALSLPVMLALSFATLPPSFSAIGSSAWIGLGYVSLFSMLIGFVFWYRGLAQGGIAAVGQLQLLQPFFGLALAASLLHEQVSPLMVVVTLGVVACVFGAKKFAR